MPDHTPVPGGEAPLLAARDISKRYRGVQALDRVDVDVRAGEILGLVGENGSGKSTLVKILAGAVPPGGGRVVRNGRDVRWRSASDALAAGIGLVAQEVLVQPRLSVAENLLFGRLPRRAGVIDWAAARTRASGILAALDLPIRPDTEMGRLPLQMQQMVAIAKMVDRAPAVLLLDEPTSSLSEAQVETVSTALRRLRDSGCALVFITHRLKEYFELCDRLTVLRDGRLVGHRAISDLDESGLVRDMVGRELSSIFVRPGRPPRAPAAAPLLELRDVRTRRLAEVSFRVAPGEIIGIAGQAGSGRSSLGRALFGIERSGGQILIDGRPVRLRSATEAIGHGIAYVPEDRKAQGLVLSGSVHDNLNLPSQSLSSRVGLRRPTYEREVTRAAVEGFRIRVADPAAAVSTLSGGNQQKVVIGKWLRRRPRLLILDEPTRGVDVGAKDEIYRIIDRLAAEGTGVIVISSELLELIRLSDRILVVADGRIVGEQQGDDASEESLTQLAFTSRQEVAA